MRPRTKKPRILFDLVRAGGALALAACASSTATQVPQPTYTEEGGTGSNDAADGGRGDGEAGGADPKASWTKNGYVYLAQTRGSEPESRKYRIEARFGSVPTPFAATLKCLEFAIGSCVLETCQSVQPPPLLAAYPSPGAITVANATTELKLEPGPLPTGPDIPGVYNPAFGESTEFIKGGEDIRIVAEGREVAAFSKNLRIDPFVELEPLGLPIDAAGFAQVDRTNDLMLRWNPAERSGKVEVALGNAKASRCIFEGSAGMGVVPSALLKELVPGFAFIRASTFATSDETAGDYRECDPGENQSDTLTDRRWSTRLIAQEGRRMLCSGLRDVRVARG
jgi:hypothetical protein